MTGQKEFVTWMKENYPSVLNNIEEEVSQEADRLVRELSIENAEQFRTQYIVRQVARFTVFAYKLFGQFDKNLLDSIHQNIEKIEEVKDAKVN